MKQKRMILVLALLSALPFSGCDKIADWTNNRDFAIAISNRTRSVILPQLDGRMLGAVNSGFDHQFMVEVRTAESSQNFRGYGGANYAMYAYVTFSAEDPVNRRISRPKRVTIYNDRVNYIEFVETDFSGFGSTGPGAGQ